MANLANNRVDLKWGRKLKSRFAHELNLASSRLDVALTFETCLKIIGLPHFSLQLPGAEAVYHSFGLKTCVPDLAGWCEFWAAGQGMGANGRLHEPTSWTNTEAKLGQFAACGISGGWTLPLHVQGTKDGHPAWCSFFCLGEQRVFSATIQSLEHDITYLATLAAIRASHVGQSSGLSIISDRERECLCQVALGKTTKSIARELNISPRTVDFHIANAMRRLDVATRAAAVAKISQCASMVP